MYANIISLFYFYFVWDGFDRSIRYEALQSEAGKMLLRRSGRAPDDISSVVLVENNRYVCLFKFHVSKIITD